MKIVVNSQNKEDLAPNTNVTFSTFDALVAAQIDTSELLAREVIALLVHPKADPKLAIDGAIITRLAFAGDDTALRSCENNYRRIVAGETRHLINDPESSDHGRDFESVCYFVYYREGTAIGIGGIYRYLDEPKRFWLGRYAIDPANQGQGYGQVVLGHILSLVSRLGGTTLDAFTEDDVSNSATHRFYERAGFERLPTTIQEFGHTQRIYRRQVLCA